MILISVSYLRGPWESAEEDGGAPLTVAIRPQIGQVAPDGFFRL
jgi:hypothetical protein